MLMNDPISPRRSAGACSIVISCAPVASPPSARLAEETEQHEGRWCHTPMLTYVGRARFKKNEETPINISVRSRTFLRPCRSPRMPNSRPPAGRAMNPTLKLANEPESRCSGPWWGRTAPAGPSPRWRRRRRNRSELERRAQRAADGGPSGHERHGAGASWCAGACCDYAAASPGSFPMRVRPSCRLGAPRRSPARSPGGPR